MMICVNDEDIAADGFGFFGFVEIAVEFGFGDGFGDAGFGDGFELVWVWHGTSWCCGERRTD